MRNRKKRTILLPVLAFCFVVFSVVFGIGNVSDVAFAAGPPYALPLAEGTSLAATETQQYSYLIFNDKWRANGDLEHDIILDRFGFDLDKACRKVSGYHVSWTGNNFECRSNKDRKIAWVSAAENHYYTVGTKDGLLKGEGSKNISGTITMTFDKAARRASDGAVIPITIKISNIVVAGGGGEHYSVALLTGFKKGDWGKVGWYKSADKNKSGLLNFSSFEYSNTPAMGVSYDVEVYLETSDSGNYRMPWAFSDIDQPDHHDGGKTYDKGGRFAEHVLLKSSGAGLRGYNAHKDTKLKVGKNGAVYYNGTNSNTVDSDLLVHINAPKAYLKYEWGGSSCSTEVIDAPSFLFENSTKIKYGGVDVANNSTYKNNSSLVVHNNKHEEIWFYHTITRLSNYGLTVPYAQTQFEIVASDNSGKSQSGSTHNLCRWTGATPPDCAKHTLSKSVHKSISPGDERTVQQVIKYQRTNMNESYVVTPRNGDCTLPKAVSGGQCIQIYRPPANFTGKITAVAEKKDSNGITLQREEKNTDTNNGGEIKIELPIDSGKYSVKFTQSVTRKDLSTYGTAGSSMKADITSYTKRTDLFRKDNNSVIDKKEGETSQSFEDGDTKNVRSMPYSSDNQYGGISGELYYGESVKYCNHLNTVSRLKKRDPADYDERYICVTISRPSKPCSEKVIKTGAETKVQPFGVYFGRNYGAIGVTNLTNKQSESTKITSADGNIEGVLGNVFAKPGDSIQFEYNMCAGAFYTAQANDLGKRNDVNFGSRYGAEGQLEHGALKDTAGIFKTSGSDGYLFKNTLPMVDSIYSNPAKYVTIGGGSDGRADWRWSDGQKAESPMNKGRFMTNTTTRPWFASAEDTETSPDINDTTYECMHQKSVTDSTPIEKKNNSYQISGKQSTKSGESKCHQSLNSVFDVGGTISQSLYWNNLYISVTGVNRTAKASGAYQNSVATAYVKVPYNYILKPFVENNNNGEDVNTKVVYLGETYKMTPGVVTAPRKNYRVTYNDTEYATITKETHVKLETYYIHDGDKNEVGGDDANTHDKDIIMRFNQDGYLGNASDVVKTIEFKIPDSDTGNVPSVGDKICTDITVWPADSHDHPDADYSEAEINKSGGEYENAGGERGIAKPLNNPYLNIALREDSVDGAINSRTTTSCSMVAKRPTMSVESGNAYSKSGYNMSKYAKYIGNRDYVFSSWSEYGVFGTINDAKQHLISGAAVGYNRSSSYYKVNLEGQKKNKTRSNSGDVLTDKTSLSKTCIFETQTFANTNCENNNAAIKDGDNPKEIDIGGQSVTDYKQKILDRYGNNEGVDATTNGKWNGDYDNVSPLIPEGEDNNYLMRYTKNSGGSGAIVVNLGEKSFIGGDVLPGEIPKAFKDDEGNDVDYNRTLVLNAKGGTVVIDGDINYNYKGADVSKTSLDDVVGVVIIADNVYFTDRPTHIDAVIIANKEVNTCKYYGGKIVKINKKSSEVDGNEVALSSEICNNELIFEAPVITNKLVLNRTAGAENGMESIKRAEIFNLNMAYYLWSFNQMSRYSQAVTTYSRELPSRY